MNPRWSFPQYEELEAPYPSGGEFTPQHTQATQTAAINMEGTTFHCARVPKDLKTQLWYWMIVIPQYFVWISVLIMVLSTTCLLQTQQAKLEKLSLPCPLTEKVQLSAPCQFCNVTAAVLIVERGDREVMTWPQCDAPKVIQQTDKRPEHLVKYLESDSLRYSLESGPGRKNATFRFVTVTLWGWYLEDNTVTFDPSTYNARVLHVLVFSCTDDVTAAASPSVLDVQISRHLYQADQPWLASGTVVWNRLFVAFKPAHGFAVLP